MFVVLLAMSLLELPAPASSCTQVHGGQARLRRALSTALATTGTSLCQGGEAPAFVLASRRAGRGRRLILRASGSHQPLLTLDLPRRASKRQLHNAVENVRRVQSLHASQRAQAIGGRSSAPAITGVVAGNQTDSRQPRFSLQGGLSGVHLSLRTGDREYFDRIGPLPVLHVEASLRLVGSLTVSAAISGVEMKTGTSMGTAGATLFDSRTALSWNLRPVSWLAITPDVGYATSSIKVVLPTNPFLAGVRSHFPKVSYRGWQAGITVVALPTNWLEFGAAFHATAVRGPGTNSSVEPGSAVPCDADLIANLKLGRQLIGLSAGARRHVAAGVQILALSVQLGIGVQI